MIVGHQNDSTNNALMLQTSMVLILVIDQNDEEACNLDRRSLGPKLDCSIWLGHWCSCWFRSSIIFNSLFCWLPVSLHLCNSDVKLSETHPSMRTISTIWFSDVALSLQGTLLPSTQFNIGSNRMTDFRPIFCRGELELPSTYYTTVILETHIKMS